MTDTVSGPTTLDVSGLSVEFRTTERIVRAVRDVSFTRQPGRNDRDRR